MTGTRRLITLESKAQAQKKNEEGILRLRLQMSDPTPEGPALYRGRKERKAYRSQLSFCWLR